MRPRKVLDPYVMLTPTAGLLAIFFFYPLAYAAYTSLFAWDLLTPPRYVGFEHYASLIRSGQLGRVLGRTLAFSVVVVGLSTSLGLALALLLSRRSALAAFVRGAIFSAYVVSWVSVALLWLWVLDPQGGALSGMLDALSLPTADWLSDPGVALWSIAGVTVWKIVGYSMVLFVAGLQDVPADLLEAAALDGAGPFRRFTQVTWPLLRPTAAFVGTTSLILSFQVFDVVRIMTQGGPIDATSVFVYAIYEQIFLDLRVGRASALVMCFFVALLALTALQLWAWRRKEAP